MKRSFKDLSPAEVLALAISLEEEDSRILQEFARLLRPNYPKAAAELDAMRGEEDGHRHRLVDVFRRRHGEEIPLLHREDIKGFVRRDPISSIQPWDVARIRSYVALMELETGRFYSKAAATTSDAELRQLLGDLAEEERHHEARSATLAPEGQPQDEHAAEARVARQLFVMQVIQPGLVGLMDGSVSTLAPLFAAAFATRSTFSNIPRRAWPPPWGRPSAWGLPRPFRRRQPDGPRPALSPRRGLCPDDLRRRDRACLALSDSDTSGLPRRWPRPWSGLN